MKHEVLKDKDKENMSDVRAFRCWVMKRYWIALGVLVVCFCLSLVLCFVLLVDKMSARMAEERLCESQSNAGHLLLGSRGATDADIEIARRMLYSAYKVDRDDFNASHKNMGGSIYSLSMLTLADDDFDDGWHKVATNWFYATARDDLELRQMQEYNVGVSDLKYTRDELRQVMAGWKSASSGRGVFEGQELCFTNGVAMYTNKVYNCNMELRLLKDQIWVYNENVCIFASSDIVANRDAYVASDALVDNWLLHFKGDRLVDCPKLKHGSLAFENLRYHFQPDFWKVVITSVKSGDIVGELFFGLRKRVDSKGVESREFEIEGLYMEDEGALNNSKRGE